MFININTINISGRAPGARKGSRWSGRKKAGQQKAFAYRCPAPPAPPQLPGSPAAGGPLAGAAAFLHSFHDPHITHRRRHPLQACRNALRSFSGPHKPAYASVQQYSCALIQLILQKREPLLPDLQMHFPQRQPELLPLQGHLTFQHPLTHFQRFLMLFRLQFFSLL